MLHCRKKRMGVSSRTGHFETKLPISLVRTLLLVPYHKAITNMIRKQTNAFFDQCQLAIVPKSHLTPVNR